jgi:YggT family protein
MQSWVLLILQALRIFIELLDLLILARCICSWIPALYGNPIVQLVYRLTEPILAPIRRLLSRSPLGGGMGVDFSPVIAGLLLMAVYRVVAVVLIALVY